MPHAFLPEETPLTPDPLSHDATAPLEKEREATAEESAAITAAPARFKTKLRHRNFRFWTMSLLFSVALMASLLFCAWAAAIRSTPFVMLGVGFLLAVFAVFFGMALRQEKKPCRSEVTELVQSGSLQTVGLLLDSLKSVDSVAERKVVMGALATLLPQFKASDAALLTPDQRKLLAMVLQLVPYTPHAAPETHSFQLAVLKALEQVGDEQAIPMVTRLANLKGRSERWQEIREAAQECLLHLEARQGEETARMTLLRGSTPESVAPETLLRAAASGPQTPTDQLLRPTDTV